MKRPFRNEACVRSATRVDIRMPRFVFAVRLTLAALVRARESFPRHSIRFNRPLASRSNMDAGGSVFAEGENRQS